MNVTAATIATRSNNYLLTGRSKISNLIKRLLCNWIKLAHNGSQRHLEQQILSVRAMTAGALTVSAALCFKVMLIAVINQGRELRICNNDNIAAVTTIATIRATAKTIATSNRFVSIETGSWSSAEFFINRFVRRIAICR